MCAQPVVCPQLPPMLSTTQLGWLPVPYYTQQEAEGFKKQNPSREQERGRASRSGSGPRAPSTGFTGGI